MNQQDRHARASAMFLELRSCSDVDREHRLHDLASTDAALASEVRSLLLHDVTNSAAFNPDATATRIGAMKPASSSAGADCPARIGPYRVIERIGRGGSGFVMLAEQDEPVHRRVAIKVVPHAALDRDFAARFEVERKALERTDHPNIARILDAGCTGDGLPYLVMDFIEGVSITEHCQREGLSLRERMVLMLDVADAVQHAHQRGVIHRDLKPANILVGDVAGRPTPRVLDFGIAKPIPDLWATNSASPATIGAPLGTPAYMAPEQTGGLASHAIIDTRADVYALGAVMYELVCGKPANDVRSGDPIESLRRIREVAPPPASRERARNASMFAVDPVPASMLADLDCVLAKALEKDPDRRYPTIAAFAADLKRVLRREPIEARAPTLAYRAARFAQRNRAVVAAAAAFVMIVTAAFIAQAIAWGEAVRQRTEAINQTDAQREINRFLTDDLLAAVTPEEEGHNISALELLRRASAKVDQRFALRPHIAASIHHTLGSSFSSLGAYDDAERHLVRAIDLRAATGGANAPDAVRSQIALASVRAKRAPFDVADNEMTSVVARARLILGRDDPALYTAIHDLGALRETQDRGDEAVALLREALDGRRRLLGERDPLVLMSMSALAMAYERVGDDARALRVQIDALRIAEMIQPPPMMALLSLNNNVGATYQDLNRDEEAEPYLRKAVELARGWLGTDHPDTLTITMNLASLESELGDADAALDLIRDVLDSRLRTLGPAAYETLLARYAMWNIHYKSKHYRQAVDGFLELLPDIAAAMGDNHWVTVQTRASLALALHDDGRSAEALPHAQRAVDQFNSLYGPDHSRTVGTLSTLNAINARLADSTP